MENNYLFQFLINGIITGSIYALLGLGFSFVYNTTRIFHITYGVLFTIGGYFCYACFVNHVSLLPSLVVGVIGASIIGYAIERWTYRPLYKLDAPLVIYMITSIGVMIFLINLIAIIWGNDVKILSSGISNVMNVGGIIISNIQILQFITSVLITTSLLILLNRSRIGIFFRAMRDDGNLSINFGIDIFRMRSYIFVLSSALAGLAGGLIAYDVGISPYGGMEILLISIVALIIGGIGHFGGVILGGFLLGFIQALVASQLSIKWSGPTVFVILVLFLLFKPQGLFGRKAREI